MPSGSHEFPDWFVPDCPPSDADDAVGEAFRFVSSYPVDPKQFLSYHETGELPMAPACRRCGLSVFRRVEDIRSLLRHLRKAYPKKEYGSHVVRRLLAPGDGVIKLTGKDGHHTWWASKGVARHEAFEFVETIERS